jgi:hypothetical protein
MASGGDHIARRELSNLGLAPQQCAERWIERDRNVDAHAAPRSDTTYRSVPPSAGPVVAYRTALFGPALSF